MLIWGQDIKMQEMFTHYVDICYVRSNSPH